MALIVQKFGGSSVKDRDRIFNVARIVANTHNAGNDVVVVVSAQGDTTDDLITKAAEITHNPSAREMDMLLAAGEEISISLLAMAPQVEAKPQPGIGFDCPESGIPEMDEDQRLKNEKEALGFFLTSHPLQPFSREMRRLRLTTLEDARDLYPKAELSTAVLVVSLKEVITKSKGERMAFVGVEDLTGHAEVTFFPRAYAEARELLKSEQPLCLRATVDSQVDESRDSDEDGEETSREVKLLGQSVTLLSEACGQSDTPICVQIPAHRLGEEDILALKAILEAHPGNVEAEAMVLLDGVRCHLTLGPQFRVSPGPELDRALAAWAG